MGNAAPRMRHDYATASATTGGRRKRCSKNAEAANVPASGRASTVARKRPDEKVAGRGEAENSAAATGVTVKVVLRRKDAERLIARLNEQNAMGRKARMAEIKNELGRGTAPPPPPPRRAPRGAGTHGRIGWLRFRRIG